MSTESVTTEYTETADEHRLTITHRDRRVTIAQNATGYAICSVRADGEELERYYALEMALDHACEYLGVQPNQVDLPAGATELGI